MWNARTNKERLNVTSGIEVTLKELIDLRVEVLHQSVDSVNLSLNLPGQKLTSIRGRGIEFDATREYQAGDDIRSMAWRVTARSLKPHIKVYREEQERPVWLALDLSPSQYFGTRRMFKSVKSIKQAAKLGWTYLLKRERIGAMIAVANNTFVYRPKSSEQHYMMILDALADSSHFKPQFTEGNYLHKLLLSLQQQVRSDHLVFILSDYFDFNSENQKLLLHIAQRAKVVMIFVYDRFEAEAPPPHQYMLTNGQQDVLFDMNDAKNREEYQRQFETKHKQLIDFTRRYNIALQIIRTDQS